MLGDPVTVQPVKSPVSKSLFVGAVASIGAVSRSEFGGGEPTDPGAVSKFAFWSEPRPSS